MRAKRRHARLGLMRDERGMTAVEFALVAPWLFALMLGILELGTALFAQSMMDAAARDAARAIRTGNVQLPPGSSASGAQAASDAFKAILCQETGNSAGQGLVAIGLLDCQKFVFDVQSFSTITALNTAINPTPPATAPAPSQQFLPGNPGDYVAVQVIYNRPSLLPAAITHLLSTETLEATVIFRNEPFQQAAPS